MGIGKTLKGLLGAVAPTLATAVSGPFSGVAMKFLADKFTGGNTGEVEDFLLAGSPEVMAQLKMADKDFDVQMKKLDIDIMKIDAGDRASARDLAKTKGMAPQIILSVVYSVGYFAVVYMFMMGHINVEPAHEVMFGGLLGVLTTAQVQIMNFWFGSSSGSKQKTDALAKG